MRDPACVIAQNKALDGGIDPRLLHMAGNVTADFSLAIDSTGSQTHDKRLENVA